MSMNLEKAFLPAAIEIQETPPAPLGRALVWIILAFFVSSVVWASVSEVDIVAVARGRIIPTGHSKTVQALEIGTVVAIHAREGQTVEAGEVLLELDSSSVQADVTRLQDERDIAQRELRRFRQLADWLHAGATLGESDLQHAGDRLLVQQWREFADRLAVLQREQERRLAELYSARQQVEKLRAVLPLVTRRANDQKGLAAQKLLPEQQYLQTEQERLEIFHDLGTRQSRVDELEAGTRELSARITFARSEFHRQVLQDLEQARRRLSAAVLELRKAESRARAQIIRAPVGGVVQQLAIRNVGAVVTPAQELLVIVPQDERLEVEAMLENRDVGFVAVAQPAEIKIDTFPFTRYGTVTGRIVDISGDAVADERKGLVFRMRVAMDRSAITVNDRDVALGPGMSVTVESKTGSRRLIEYFLSPLLRYRDESVRER